MQLDVNLGAGRWPRGRASRPPIRRTCLPSGVLGAARERAVATGWRAVALFAALLTHGGFLALAEPTRRLLCLLLAALWLARAAAETGERPQPRARAFLLFGLLAVLALAWAPGAALAPALAAGLLLGTRGGTGAVRADARAAAWSAAVLGFWHWAVAITDPGWRLGELLARGVSLLSGAAAGGPLALGADVAGVPILIGTAAFLMSRAADGAATGHRARAAVIPLGGLLLVAVVALAALARWFPESPAPAQLCLRQLLLFGALIPVLALTANAAGEADDPRPPAAPVRTEAPSRSPLTPGTRAALAIVALCVLGSCAIWMRRPVSLVGQRIGILSDSSAAWLPSVEAGYGGTAAPILGDCADLLAALGARVSRVSGPLDARALAELDALILPTPARPFDAASASAVAAFVRRGGGLMALAEHTDLAGNRRHLNPILAPFGISVNDDSALAVPGEPWRSAFAVRPHAVIPGEVSPDRHGVAIGASLALSGPARPLLVGRGLFADRAAPGPALGNLQYSRPERMGDVVVAATSTPESGRVLVFGDPSPLMNYPLHSTDGMIARGAAWLTGGLPDFGGPMVAGFLACALLALLATPGRRPGQRLLVALLAAPLAVLLAPVDALAVPPPLPPGRAALIDTSHRPALATGDSFNTSTAGAARGLRRAGLLPSRMDRWDDAAVARAGALLLFSPTRDLSSREATAIDRMLARGGTLLVATGGAELPPTPRLDAYLGARVAPTPLGPVAATVGGREARFPSAWAIDARDPACHPLAARWDRPVVVEARRGAGRIVLVGDPAVFLGDHTEGHERFDEGNIALFQRLIRGEDRADGPLPEVRR
jgi:hypothetical protein